MLLTVVNNNKRQTAENTNVLRKVLIRAGAWGASTDNVERMFGLLKHKQPKERNRMDESFVRDKLFLLTVMGESAQDHEQWAQAAARVWPKVYGHARVGSCADGKLHRRRTVDGGATPKPETQTTWKQKRRADVDCIVEHERATVVLAADAPAKLIDVNKERRSAVAEALFQRRKRFKQAIDSMREGSLTPAEQVAELGSEQAAQEALPMFWPSGGSASALERTQGRNVRAANENCSRKAVGQTQTHRHNSRKQMP